MSVRSSAINERRLTSTVDHNRHDWSSGWQATFGPFRLMSNRKQLLRGDRPVRLGGRAFDVLQVLVENAGDFVDKRRLFDRAWPNLTVDETNLRTAIAAVRRAFREGGSEPCRGAGRYL
jgi:DNA-binding winged helix-turn-helix (wHTH) protein